MASEYKNDGAVCGSNARQTLTLLESSLYLQEPNHVKNVW